MNLKKYDRTNSFQKPGSDLAIAYGKGGNWTISTGLKEAMGLKDGDTIALLQDADNPLDWYLTKDKDGFETRANSGGTALLFNCADCRRRFMDAWLKEKDEPAPESARMLVAAEPVKLGKQELWPMLSGSLSTRGRGRKRSEP